MKRLSLSFLFPLVALTMFILVLDRQVFQTPPLGRFLNPFIGMVQNEQATNKNKNLALGVKEGVEVMFDDRAVPHIFANNQNDMYFAQGYVCASDRLWQMDFMSYASAGRLSEFMGDQYLDYDRLQRRNGMLSSAIESLSFIEQNAETKAVLDNYTAGVNAWIESLVFTNLPIEYKLLDYSPEPWTNLKSVLIMKYVSASLSGYEQDVSASYMRMVLGAEEYDNLFPNYCIADTSEVFAIHRILDSLPANEYIDYSFLEAAPQLQGSNFNPRLGSNSWAIGPEKSASGAALLCSDPHLNLSFPAIWYEVQLKSNEQNAYGYSIPGVPGAIIGFNDRISWGLTNGSTDVRDYYKLDLQEDYAYYKYDGRWLETEMHIEEIKIKNENSFFDTIYYSIHGPIASDFRFGSPEIKGCAVDWTLHDPSNEFLAFIQINKAKNYGEFKQAIKYYQCPVQNFSYADVDGNIGLHYQGKVLASQWKDQGKFIMDGTRSKHFSNLNVQEDLPHSYNPSRGYVYSANNNPYGVLDSSLIYGHYAELRADKIDVMLSAKNKLTVDDMKAMQLDNTNRLSELALPILLAAMPTSNNAYLIQLAKWDSKFNKDAELALVFERWWSIIKNNTWDELMRFKALTSMPDDLILLDMIANAPNSAYFDLQSTEKIESAADIIAISFNEIWDDPSIYLDWGSFNKIQIMHLANIRQFSELGIPLGGHPNALNALSENWGPSLRMVVEMGERPHGYGIYVGGQSGNPGSTEYDRFVEDWANGAYYELQFYEDKQDGQTQSKYKWILK